MTLVITLPILTWMLDTGRVHREVGITRHTCCYLFTWMVSNAKVRQPDEGILLHSSFFKKEMGA